MLFLYLKAPQYAAFCENKEVNASFTELATSIRGFIGDLCEMQAVRIMLLLYYYYF